MNKLYLFSLCLLMFGCGGSSNSSQNISSLPNGVSESIGIGQPLVLDWQQSTSDGGKVFSTVSYKNAIYANLGFRVWRYQQDVWQEVAELRVGSSQLLTTGDFLITDSGSVFDGNTVKTSDLLHDLLAFDQDQQRIYAANTHDDSLYFSDDFGETFELLSTVKGRLRDIVYDSYSNSLLVLADLFEGRRLLRFNSSQNVFTSLGDFEYFDDLSSTINGSVFAMGAGRLVRISGDTMTSWVDTELPVSGIVKMIGELSDGIPVIAIDSLLFYLDGDQFIEIIQLSANINGGHIESDEQIVLATDDGVWVVNKKQSYSASRIGVPGNYILGIAQDTDGPLLAGYTTGPQGHSYIAKYDPLNAGSGWVNWSDINFFVHDYYQLDKNKRLIIGGWLWVHGDFYPSILSDDGQIIESLQSFSGGLDKFIVIDQSTFLMQLDRSNGSQDKSIWLSEDQGQSWSDLEILDENGTLSIARACGRNFVLNGLEVSELNTDNVELKRVLSLSHTVKHFFEGSSTIYLINEANLFVVNNCQFNSIKALTMPEQVERVYSHRSSTKYLVKTVTNKLYLVDDDTWIEVKLPFDNQPFNASYTGEYIQVRSNGQSWLASF